MKNKYTYTDSQKMTVLQALLSGHTLNIGNDAFRYYHKGSTVRIDKKEDAEYVATESQLFQRYGTDKDHWIGLTGDLNAIMRIIGKASQDEVSAIIGSFTLDMNNRESNVKRQFKMVANKLTNNSNYTDKLLLTHLAKNEPVNVSIALVDIVYDELQANNDFPMSRRDFVVNHINEDEDINDTQSFLFDRIDVLVDMGKLKCVPVAFDATPYYQAT